MADFLQYKGFLCKMEYMAKTDALQGVIIGIADKIIFSGQCVDEVREAFHSAVEAYILRCKEEPKLPCQSFSGTFNVRIGPELHREAVILAAKEEKSLNRLVEDAIKSYVRERSRPDE